MIPRHCSRIILHRAGQRTAPKIIISKLRPCRQTGTQKAIQQLPAGAEPATGPIRKPNHSQLRPLTSHTYNGRSPSCREKEATSNDNTIMSSSTVEIPITPLAELRVSRHAIPPHKDGLIPNSAATSKPLLVYHAAFPRESVTADAVEAHLESVGAVVPQWRYTMYSTTHFHSTTHEVLGAVKGAARLCFGGEENPGRVEEEVTKGDVIVVPAGVGHRLLEDVSEDGEGFEMVGSYPPGCEWDMCYGRKGEEEKVKKIGDLDWFKRDPVYGDDGPVLKV